MRTDHYDALETRPAETREAALMAALPGQIAHARAQAPYFAARLAAIDPAAITSRDALATLPLTRKADLSEHQRAAPPFGGMAAGRGLIRIYQSPGPIYDPEGGGRDWWRSARALFAAGFRPGDLVHNCFSYHLTPAGMMFETGAHALGCAVFPGGTGNSEAQARAIADLRPAGYVGTPSFLPVILDRADHLGLDGGSLKRALVTGEALAALVRAGLAGRGIEVAQCYGTADLGVVAYESPAREGMIVNEGIIVELVEPGGGRPVAPGEVGEIVVTSFNPDYPLIRFATGDLSAELTGPSPCGRTAPRLRGWLGRADQSAKARGVFVHPHQISELTRRHPAITRARLEISSDGQRDHVTLHVETSASPDLIPAIQDSLRAITKLTGEVRLHPPATLGEAGGLIDDTRRPPS